MNDLVFEQSARLRREKTPYALATIIAVRGSASARPGAKAVISLEGKNLAGWVGGGCAESFICAQAQESLTEQKPRIVTADLDDEVFGLGVPCGGVMDVYIEPVLPPGRLSGLGKTETDQNHELTQLVHWHATHLGLEVYEGEGGSEDIAWVPTAIKNASNVEKSLLGLAQSLAFARGRGFQPLSHAAEAATPASASVDTPLGRIKGLVSPLNKCGLRARGASESRFWVVGKGRITEELVRFAAQLQATLRWTVHLVSSVADPTLYPLHTQILTEMEAIADPPAPGDFVVIASHHRGDSDWIERSLAGGVAYVGLVASRHRVGLILEELRAREVPEASLSQLRGPAGLDMDCRSPSEIALSIVAEILSLIHA